MKSRRLSVSLATLLAVALGMTAVCSGGNKHTHAYQRADDPVRGVCSGHVTSNFFLF